MKSKIGIMGGTFNPIHNGHLTLAVEAYKQFNLDKVLVMVSPNPPHKHNETILPIEKRVDMVKLAVAEYPDILEFSDLELKRSGYIYTAETLTFLKEDNPENEYYFIVGGDSIKNIESWRTPEIIFKKAVIIAAIRDEMDIPSITGHISHLKAVYNCDIRLLSIENIPISSSCIRNFISNGQNISDMVPSTVADYISDNNLYRE